MVTQPQSHSSHYVIGVLNIHSFFALAGKRRLSYEISRWSCDRSSSMDDTPHEKFKKSRDPCIRRGGGGGGGRNIFSRSSNRDVKNAIAKGFGTVDRGAT